jgi:hypothetical protein
MKYISLQLLTYTCTIKTHCPYMFNYKGVEFQQTICYDNII